MFGYARSSRFYFVGRLFMASSSSVSTFVAQASKFVKIHGRKLLLLRLRAGSKTIFVVAN